MTRPFPEPGAAPRILVIRRHNHVGDMLCSLPLYAAFRARWPRARIDLLATPTRYPIPLHEINPFLDTVRWYRKGSVGEVLRAHRELRAEGYDLAVVPSTVALSRTSHITAFLSGAHLRVGVRTLDGTVNGGHRLLNVKKDVVWGGTRVHQEERNREIAALAGCELSNEEMRALRIPVDEAAAGAAEEALGRFGDGRPLIGVHPGAGKPQNVWPTERFAEAVQRVLSLEQLRGAGVVVTAGALDDAEVERLGSDLQRRGIAFLVLRSLPIPSLSAVFRRLRLYLTNDTGTMHVAAYSGCSTVSLFGPTHAWEWAPRGAMHRAVESTDGSMEGIEVQRVVEAMESLMTNDR